MKKFLKYIPIAALSLVACEPEFDNAVEDGFYSSGEANFSNYVSIGNSLTAGFADSALYITGQENSYPNIMAQQFELVGGGEFTQPLMNDNLGGLLLGGTQITQNRFVLAVGADGNPSPSVLSGTPTTEVTATLSGPFNNIGVPGAKSYHLVAPGYGNAAGVATGQANPYYARFASSADATVIGEAVTQDPSFFSLWIGNNDILGYATSGGSGVDQTGNFDPSTYGSSDITDPNVFASVYSQMVDLMVGTGADGVLVNLPDVTSVPFFTTVPTQSIPLDADTAAALNANFAAYNTQVLGGLLQAGVITQEEFAARQINFTEGVNFPIMVDDDLTNIAAIISGPPFNLPAPTAGLLAQLRQVNSTDLMTLTSSSVLGTPVAGVPNAVNGVSFPLADQFVLTVTEQARVSAAQASYNATIQALAQANGLAFVDARAALQAVAAGGVAFDGGVLSSTFATGGAFSLDGVHPTPRGYAFTANAIIDAINEQYGATVPKVNIGNYATITASND